MIYSVDIRITAPVNDTEIAVRVTDAIENVFPGGEVESDAEKIVAEAHSVEHFSELLHRQEILDTARGEFFSGQDGNTLSFDLNKQAAFQGVVNFAVGNPDELGELHVRMQVDDPTVEEFVDYVAPPTEDGKPIEPGDER
jgi:predicted RNA binding protein with dsRBD fold (UPF0201 family)